MKAVIITADGPEHRFVTRCLVESLGNHLCGVVIERGKENTPIWRIYRNRAAYNKDRSKIFANTRKATLGFI